MEKETIPPEWLEKADQIRKKYRATLLRVGKSPDYHIYDLDLRFILNVKTASDRLFLQKLLRFYRSLGEEDKKIFVNEVLEKERHYRFWFLEDYRGHEFERRKGALLSTVGRL